MKLTIHDLPAFQKMRITKPLLDLDTAPYAVTLLRLSLGLLFVAHGALKLFTFTLPGTAQFFVSVGLPGFMAYIVTPLEIVGGILMILGLFTRWVSLILFPILLVATVRVHGASGWLFTNEGGGWEFPAFFGIATLVQFLLGDGAYSLSAYLARRR